MPSLWWPVTTEKLQAFPHEWTYLKYHCTNKSKIWTNLSHLENVLQTPEVTGLGAGAAASSVSVRRRFTGARWQQQPFLPDHEWLDWNAACRPRSARWWTRTAVIQLYTKGGTAEIAELDENLAVYSKAAVSQHDKQISETGSAPGNVIVTICVFLNALCR